MSARDPIAESYDRTASVSVTPHGALFAIAGKNGEPLCVVEALAHEGGLAVHEGWFDGYVVSHINSGAKLGVWPTLRKAKAAMRALLETGVDWTLPRGPALLLFWMLPETTLERLRKMGVGVRQ